MALNTGKKPQKVNTFLDIVDANSPANQYLVHLLDDKKMVSFQEPTEARIKHAFEVLNSVIPQLGVYSSLLTYIKNELQDAIYSPQLTGNPELNSEPAEPLLQVPYFALWKRRQDERNEEAQKIQLKFEQTAERLTHSEEDCLCLREEVVNLRTSEDALFSKVASLQDAIQQKEEAIQGMNEELQEQMKKLSEQKSLHMEVVREGQLQLQVSHKEIMALKDYRSRYQELQHAFQAPVLKGKPNVLLPVATKLPTQRKALIVTEQAHVSSYLKTTKHLYRQLLQIQNSVMDDFDEFVQRYRNDPLSGYSVLNGKKTAQKEEEEKEEGQQEELDQKRESFRRSMEDISAELSLLVQQKQSQEQRLWTLEVALKQELHSGEPAMQELYPGEDTTQAPGPGAAPESSRDLFEASEPRDESVRDFFYHALEPDETALNKYAAMGYISCDGGKTYQEIEGAGQCDSCGEKTLICPHKVGNNREIRLPTACTHLRICRPQAHVIMLAEKLPHRMKEQLVGRVAPLQVPLAANDGPAPQEPSTQAQGFDASRLWAHFEKQLQFRREAPREMSLELCWSFAERLFATLLFEEECNFKTWLGESVQEVLTRLFNEHYLIQDVSAFGLQDFLTAVLKYYPVCREIAVLGRVLSGDLDPSVLRYVVLMADLLNSVSWLAVRDFQVFVGKVYPFLQGEYLESIILEFTAFSENRMSCDLVMEYILKLILQGSEPLFVENEDTLKPYSKTQGGHLTSEELSAAVEELAPLTSQRLRKALIQQSAISLRKPIIPIKHAAQITSYLMARQQSLVQREHLRTALEAKRSRDGTGKDISSGKAAKPEGDLIPISKVRYMAEILQRK